MDNCFCCERIEQIKQGTNPWFVKEYETGYAVIADKQFYPGTTIFICKEDKRELFDLDRETKVTFLEEMSIVAEGVFRAFHPVKINYELLGNSVSHLHWWIIPRYEDDPHPHWPAWYGKAEERWNSDMIPTEARREELKQTLREALEAVDSRNETFEI